MKKLLLLSLTFILLFATACNKGVKTETLMKATMTYEFDVVEQDNISHYIVQVSPDTNEWTDMAMILANPNGMEHKYVVPIDVSRFYKKGEKLYQRLVSYDIGNVKYQISKVTAITFKE